MTWRNRVVLVLLIVPLPLSAQGRPELVHDSTGRMVPPGRIPARAQPMPPVPVRRGPWLNLGLGFGSVGCLEKLQFDCPVG
jgi:hypothetical protein